MLKNLDSCFRRNDDPKKNLSATCSPVFIRVQAENYSRYAATIY